MLVRLAKTNDDPRKVDKAVNVVGSANAVVFDSVDILNPSLLLDYHADWVGCNYCYIEEWGRYYFINGYDLQAGGKMVISCRVDVLKTYAEQIRNTQALILRSGSGSEIGKYIPDSTIPMDARNVTHNKLFDKNPFGAGKYVLTVLGGGFNVN